MVEYRLPLKERIVRAYRRYRRPMAYALMVMVSFFIIWLIIVSQIIRCP